ncbi:MAG: hypothetical protein K0S86_2572 [Geminicoccaceae bacterium]|nr:hypothetical protein [Geminicoccaceae bacterium]
MTPHPVSTVPPTARVLPYTRAAILAASVFAVHSASSPPLGAQGRLVGYRTSTLGPIYERWSFGDGLYQTALAGGDSVRVEGASQLTLPISLSVPLGERWSVDLSGAYASGTVSLASADTALGVSRYRVSGLTDLRLRATGRVVGDNVIVTLGVNLPTGKTSLDAEEFSAMRVLAAPAFGFQTPTLGLGAGGTAGVVVARQVAGWAWALGGSYELRNAYDPVTFVGEMNPSDAVHLSVGGDGLVGRHGMTVGVSADLFTKDRLAPLEPPGGGASGAAAAETQLGPIVTADWQLRVATSRFRELTLYAVDRYRTKYKRGGAAVDGSSGNYLDAGVRGVLPVSRASAVLGHLNVRNHTGLRSDNSLATAAITSAALTLGLVQDLGNGYALQPFARAQAGRAKTGNNSASARGLAAGVTLGMRF